MPRPALIQTQPIDVATWIADTRYTVFPQGARAKGAFLCPDPAPQPVLIAGKRYLFKHSRLAYPDQFWAEVIAYRIGCLLGVEVPPAFAGWSSVTGQCGALIEWFYGAGEASMHGGDFLQRLRPDFDRRKGTTHNMADNEVIMRALAQANMLYTDWRAWWVEAIMFDGIIGNNDRHQDNWTLIFESNPGGRCRMSPYFDNGTSLGHELFTERVGGWDAERLDRYIRAGRHHVRWPQPNSEPQRLGHPDLFLEAVARWPEAREAACAKARDLTVDQVVAALADLPEIDVPVPLTPARLNFTIELLCRRLSLLQQAIQ